MVRTTLSTSIVSQPAPSAEPPEELDNDLRTLKALRILFESRQINPSEYARRVEAFQRRLEQGAGKK